MWSCCVFGLFYLLATLFSLHLSCSYYRMTHFMCFHNFGPACSLNCQCAGYLGSWKTSSQHGKKLHGRLCGNDGELGAENQTLLYDRLTLVWEISRNHLSTHLSPPAIANTCATYVKVCESEVLKAVSDSGSGDASKGLSRLQQTQKRRSGSSFRTNPWEGNKQIRQTPRIARSGLIRLEPSPCVCTYNPHTYILYMCVCL